MVTDPSEYDYVTGADVDEEHPYGDMDRVIFNGKVMPLRIGNTANFFPNGDPIPRMNIMRGEDICFLLEAYRERAAALGWTPSMLGSDNDGGPEVFTRRLNYSQVDILHTGFRDLGARTEWVPRDTDLPQAAEIASPSDIATAWPGVSRWPSGPAADPAWAQVSQLPPLIPKRAPILNMFENLKLMRACKRAGAMSYADFSVRVSYTNGTIRTENALRYAETSLSGGWFNYSASWRVSGYTAQLQTVAQNTAASGLPVGALFRPVVLVYGQALMQTRNGSTGATTYDLSVTKYALVPGGEHFVRSDGRAYCQQSEYEAAGQFMLDLLTTAGYDGNYVQSQTSDEDESRLLSMVVGFSELFLFVRLGDHTMWWSSGS